MQTYYREAQREQILNILNRKGAGSTFNVINGRRNAGKTTIALDFADNPNAVYISLTSKAPKLQLEEISGSLKRVMPESIFVPSFSDWTDFFEFMFFVSRMKPFALFIDEFHLLSEFRGSSVSPFKKLWEKHKSEGRLHLFAITYDKGFLIDKFGAKTSPYYNMVDSYIPVEAFSLEEVIKLCKENSSSLKIKQILELYAVFGGLPKYYYLIDAYKLWNKKVAKIIEMLVLERFAPLGREHQEIIHGELNRGNRIYVGILQAIALGHQTMTDIAQFIDVPVTHMGKYLNELDKKKELIKRVQPYGFKSKVHSKFGKYEFCNPFDNFWFRFIHPSIGDFENGKTEKIMETLEQSFDTYMEERVKILLQEIFESNSVNRLTTELLEGDVSAISSLWNRKEHIDLLLLNQEKKLAAAGNVVSADGQFQNAAEQLTNSLNLLKAALPGYKRKKFLISMTERQSGEFKNSGTGEDEVGVYSLDELLFTMDGKE